MFASSGCALAWSLIIPYSLSCSLDTISSSSSSSSSSFSTSGPVVQCCSLSLLLPLLYTAGLFAALPLGPLLDGWWGPQLPSRLQVHACNLQSAIRIVSGLAFALEILGSILIGNPTWFSPKSLKGSSARKETEERDDLLPSPSGVSFQQNGGYRLLYLAHLLSPFSFSSVGPTVLKLQELYLSTPSPSPWGPTASGVSLRRGSRKQQPLASSLSLCLSPFLLAAQPVSLACWLLLLGPIDWHSSCLVTPAAAAAAAAVQLQQQHKSCCCCSDRCQSSLDLLLLLS
ncbi:hypothetical protein Emag_007490 [Eimeria magna]